MEITKTLHITARHEWRMWLSKYHATESEIWLVYYRKASGKPRIPYNDAVEEALCFGWIDSIEKKLDFDRSAQKFSPRQPNSRWSELNKERARRLIASGSMTEAGFAKLGNVLEAPFTIPADILEALQANSQTWENFQQFSDSYQRIRIGYIEEVRKRPDEFQKRLSHFLKMTAQNRKFGTIQ
jgi:uncharacterized protein YdeI (YjbR/CyaY-like superfamily)